MNHLFTKKFKSPLAYLAAFLAIIFFSMLVGAYSYVQAKQISIEADLLVAGKVRASNLCIGGACKTAWPAELVPNDYVALGAQNCSGSWFCLPITDKITRQQVAGYISPGYVLGESMPYCHSVPSAPAEVLLSAGRKYIL